MDYQISSRPAYQPLTSLVIEPVNLVMAIGNVIEHSDEDLKGGDTNNSPSHEVPQPTSIHTGILEGTLDIYEAIITGCSCYTIAMTCGFKARTRITLHTILWKMFFDTQKQTNKPTYKKTTQAVKTTPYIW